MKWLTESAGVPATHPFPAHLHTESKNELVQAWRQNAHGRKSAGEANLSMETYWVFKKQREESGEVPGAQQSCSLCSACSQWSPDQPNTIFLCLIFPLEMLCLLFCLLMLLFHKENKFKLLYLETFSSLIFRRNIQHPLSFAQLSVPKLSMKRKKRDFFLFRESPKKA